MDINEKIETFNKYLKDIHDKGKSDVVCPICKTPLKLEGDATSYSVVCQTKNCFEATFRGI